jgi:hypothetical protein
MVLEACEVPKIDTTVRSGEVSIRGQEFTHSARAINSDGFTVEQTETLATRSRGIGKSVTENLHARTNREDNSTFVDCAMESLTELEFTRCLNLRSVFTAANEVEVGRIGTRSSGVDSGVFDCNSAPFEAAWKYECISAIAVGAEKIGIERNDSNCRISGVDARGGGHSTPPTFSRCSWNAV